MTHLIISAVSGDSFRRCGHNWPKGGRIIKASDLSDKDLSRLKAEPMLHLRDATDADVPGPAIADSTNDVSARAEQIAETIGALTADDFQRDGRPKLDSLNALLGDDLGKITGAERDQVFDAMKAAGFKAPDNDAGTAD